MEIKLDVLITETKTNITYQQGDITIDKSKSNLINVDKPMLYLLWKAEALIYIGSTKEATIDNSVDFDTIIMITPPWEMELQHLEQQYINKAVENGITLTNISNEFKSIPMNQKKVASKYMEEIEFILERFGYSMKPKSNTQVAKQKSTKVQHRWNKKVSEIEFFVDFNESKATVIWQKRNEMLIKAGAKLMPVAPLNKDGSVGMAAKMGDKLRLDHADKIKDFVTTEDIVLKSVNEVGIFLYFAGTNSWLILKDVDGKTIDEWTRVE